MHISHCTYLANKSAVNAIIIRVPINYCPCGGVQCEIQADLNLNMCVYVYVKVKRKENREYAFS